MSKNSTGGAYSPRAARTKENKIGFKIFLATITFLIMICGILYGIYATQTGPEPELTAARTAPSTDKPAEHEPAKSDPPTSEGSTIYTPIGSSNSSDTKPADSKPDPAAKPSADRANSKPTTEAANVEAADSNESPLETSEPKPENNASAAPESSQAEKLPTTYVIRKGDTLSTISMKFYHSKEHVALLAKQNQIVFINDMNVGDTIKIPALSSSADSASGQRDEVDYSKVTLPATYLIRSGDTLYHISMQFYHSKDYVDLIAKQNKLDKSEQLKAGNALIIPAVPVTNQAAGSNGNSGNNGSNGSEKAATKHTVRQGETLSSISRIYFGSSSYAQNIAKYNHLTDNDDIKSGDVLKIPAINTTR